MSDPIEDEFGTPVAQVDCDGNGAETSFNHAEPAEATEAATAGAGEPFEGLSHADALERDLPAERFLVEDTIPAGTVGTIAGVPETHKSFLAQAIATRCGSGVGEVLGRNVLRQARVGYLWQDDSEREELERIKLFERVHATAKDAPLWWFLNVGLALPDDVGRLRATVDRYQLELLILDSYYSIVYGIDLRDQGAEQIVLLLKRKIADETGCTVLIVDHMPWATDSNRTRLRGYGGVHKAAAIRWGIYIDAKNNKLYVEARGNNIRGFAKTPAVWDKDALELRLIDAEHVSAEQYEERIIAHLAEHGWSLTESVDKSGGRAAEIRNARKRLHEAGRITNSPASEVGLPGKGLAWNLAQEHALHPVPLPGTGADVGPVRACHKEATPSPRPAPVGGTGFAGTGLAQQADASDEEVERLASLALEVQRAAKCVPERDTGAPAGPGAALAEDQDQRQLETDREPSPSTLGGGRHG